MNLWTEEPGPSEVTAIVTEASLCKLLQLLVDYELFLGRESPTTQACSSHRISRTTLPPEGFPNETWVKAGMIPWLTIPRSLLKSLWHKDVGVGGLFSWLRLFLLGQMWSHIRSATVIGSDNEYRELRPWKGRDKLPPYPTDAQYFLCHQLLLLHFWKMKFKTGTSLRNEVYNLSWSRGRNLRKKKNPTQGYLKFGTFWEIHVCFVSINGHFKGLDILTQLPCCPSRIFLPRTDNCP